MTYGEHLDHAAAALADVQTRLRHPRPAGITDHAAAAIARTQLYRGLERQVARIMVTGQESTFAWELHKATRATASMVPLPPHSEHPAATSLRRAADHIRTAAEILGLQFDATTGRPRTTDGLAIARGINRSANLTALARLARAASEIDSPLATWLRDGHLAGSGQPIVATAATDAARTSISLHHAANSVITGPADRHPLHALAPPPLTDVAERWTSLQEPRDTITAVDAARTWLMQHHRDLTAVDITTLTRTGLALTYEADYLIRLGAPRGTPLHSTPTAAAAWRQAAQAAEHLRSLDTPQPGVGPTVLAATEQWLRQHLRPHGTWAEPAELHRQHTTDWRTIGIALAARLPDLAALVHTGSREAIDRGRLLEAAPRALGRPSPTPRWTTATIGTRRGVDLLLTTSHLRAETLTMTREAGTTPTPGLTEADPRHPTHRDPPRTRAAELTPAHHPDGQQPHHQSTDPAGPDLQG
ncbi:hypothetical protein ACN28G_14700 [Micromonospora sp. WMMA1923]|uniref:hypothetical protein n=1 Tax=Micromonospora sp. WMMA1923 TaxID=3404125 RepID=UPI003B94FCC2